MLKSFSDQSLFHFHYQQHFLLCTNFLGTLHQKLLADIKSGKWYPKHIAELDYICNNIIMYCPNDPTGLNADHASFKDKTYRKRREWFYQLANNYKQQTIYQDLKILHRELACEEFLNNFKMLESQCGYSMNQIPQLEDISSYLKTKTGFILRPCGGYLTPRNFLAALAFRVFCCTQYIRHGSDPHYTPEPDLCHELLGHMAMLINPEFAQLTQEIGIASLGSSEENCKALARLYFFTVEFGLLTEGQEFDIQKRNLKVYGAGLLSCFDELKFCVSRNAVVRRFEPKDAILMEPEVTKFQNGYFYSTSINEALNKIKYANLQKKNL
ncbi:unnamed protein product [Thelazia callipaeda]|uniref:BH4_AAA_HYDROXYL_2 domain-containing protein n=1 Tax=Thelazia callipaeda TaxID=103827 RepID=A0A0N5CL43_THECL|nr:unnamed protein product [Thelazia callipaeda]